MTADSQNADEIDLWAERRRIAERARGDREWGLWGPYLAERQWGTVREDYSADGNAWRSFTHEDSRSRAYRWGEDGIAGISDERSFVCLSVALWNGHDRILKERLFGLTNEEGNHGEDVKEIYHYLDATPSHSYLKFLYRYPQAAFPYDDLLRQNRDRGRSVPEFELGETGILDEGRFFDITVEYAKESDDDIHVVLTATNRGPEPAVLHLVPLLTFRNLWSWRADAVPWRPRMTLETDAGILCEHPRLGSYRLIYDGAPEILFCENDTNRRLHAGEPDAPGPFKDGINAALVDGDEAAISRQGGTRVGIVHRASIEPGGSTQVRLRLSAGRRVRRVDAEDRILGRRIAEADAFYDGLCDGMEDDARFVFRQAAAGLIWSKQFYRYDVRL